MAAKKTSKTAEAVTEEKVEKAPAKKTTTKKTTAKKPAAKKAEVKEEVKVEEKKTTKKTTKKATEEKAPAKKAAAKKAPAKKTAAKKTTKKVKEEKKEETIVEEIVQETPRRSVAFIGSECYPFVKTGGLGDVMNALPKELVKQNTDVRVILPKYACIKEQYKERMEYKGSFMMDLCADGRQYYVGIMEIVEDGVVYDFIDNEELFSNGNPYTTIVDDIPKYCYFGKAALAALNYLDWIPNVVHCHDWQAGLVPVYLRTLFANTAVGSAKSIITIHNLRFQGVYNIETIKYWSNLPDYVFEDALKVGTQDANMLKGGITFADMVTTVSNTYAEEIQTEYYGEKLDGHLRYHNGKLRGIVNGIDVTVWDPSQDKLIPAPYSIDNALEQKKENKKALQESLGLKVDEDQLVIGLISRLTDQKGLDLVNAIVPQIVDDFTQLVVLGTGDPAYEDSFRYYENTYKGTVSASIMYDEARSHQIYAGCDAFLVPSLFEPCGLTQLIAMHYGAAPIVRETGGLKDTVEPYNEFELTGNGFTFDNYDASLLLDAINRAKTTYFEHRNNWDELVKRNMAKDVSWTNSALQYKYLYLELTPW